MLKYTNVKLYISLTKNDHKIQRTIFCIPELQFRFHYLEYVDHNAAINVAYVFRVANWWTRVDEDYLVCLGFSINLYWETLVICVAGRENTILHFSWVPVMHICSIMMKCSVCSCLCWLLTKKSRGVYIWLYLSKSVVPFMKLMLTIGDLDTSFKRNVFKCRKILKRTVKGNVHCVFYFIPIYI